MRIRGLRAVLLVSCCVAVIAWAALATGFTLVLGHFVPAVTEGWMAKAVPVGLMTALAIVNLFGAKSGAWVSTFFSMAKLVPLCAFVAIGVFAVDWTPGDTPTPSAWWRPGAGGLTVGARF